MTVKLFRSPLRKYFSQSGNVLPVKELLFTAREECGIIPAAMPRATVTERLRRVIKKLMDAEGHGAAVLFIVARPQWARTVLQMQYEWLYATANALTGNDFEPPARFK